jgi:hypothetical protein
MQLSAQSLSLLLAKSLLIMGRVCIILMDKFIEKDLQQANNQL